MHQSADESASGQQLTDATAMPFEVGAGSYRPKDLLDGLRLS